MAAAGGAGLALAGPAWASVGQSSRVNRNKGRHDPSLDKRPLDYSATSKRVLQLRSKGGVRLVEDEDSNCVYEASSGKTFELRRADASRIVKGADIRWTQEGPSTAHFIASDDREYEIKLLNASFAPRFDLIHAEGSQRHTLAALHIQKHGFPANLFAKSVDELELHQPWLFFDPDNVPVPLLDDVVAHLLAYQMAKSI